MTGEDDAGPPGPPLPLASAAALQLLIDEPGGLRMPTAWSAPLVAAGLARARGELTQATADGRRVARALHEGHRRVLWAEGSSLLTAWKAGRIEIVDVDAVRAVQRAAPRSADEGSNEDRRRSHFRRWGRG